MTDDALLALLPDDARAAIHELQRVPPELRSPPALRALKAVGWPPHTSPVPPLSTLTPAQHAVAMLLAPYPHLLTHSFAFPWDMWRRRRWLGLDPPGPLERPAPPSIDPTGAALGASVKTVPLRQILAALPVRDRFTVLVELGCSAWGFNNVGVDTQLSNADDFARLVVDDDGAAEAADVACALLDGPDWFPSRGDLPVTVRGALLVAMARGKGIAPRHDRLLPLTTAGWTTEIVRALPVVRRAPAIVAATQKNVLAYYVEPLLLELLPLVPDARVLEALRRFQGQSRPLAASEKDLRALAKKHPAVAALVGDLKAPEKPRLTLVARELPPLDDLDDLLRHQIGSEALENAEGEADMFERFDVVDGGNVVYEFVLFCGDDAAVFHKGTKNVVASFSQGGATGTTDARLIADLDRALYEFREATKKKTTKKTKKKTATKKAATKKTKKKTATKKK